jgi:EpsI family protein
MNKNTIAYVVLILFLCLTCVLSVKLFFREREDRDLLHIGKFPYEFSEWSGSDLKVSDRDYDILETRNLIYRKYANPENKKISLFIVYSETNRAVFHPPEVCIIGSGMKILDKRDESLNLSKKNITINKLFTGKNDAKQMVLYCYKAGNLYTNNYYMQQAFFAFNQLLGKRIQGATIRVSMPVVESEEIALARLKEFMKRIITNLEKL